MYIQRERERPLMFTDCAHTVDITLLLVVLGAPLKITSHLISVSLAFTAVSKEKFHCAEKHVSYSAGGSLNVHTMTTSGTGLICF